MPERAEPGFRVVNFDNLRDGRVKMSSPSVNNILQIGLEKYTQAYQGNKVPLLFEKSGAEILFARKNTPKDHIPLQIELVGYNAAYATWDSKPPEDGLHHRYPVLVEPVDELHFVREDNGLWHLSGDKVISVQSERTRKFMHTVALGAYAKQKKVDATPQDITDPDTGVV